MYTPEHFAETRPEVLHGLIHDHPLGVLIVRGSGGLDANHLPFALTVTEDQASLVAHVARANDVWRVVDDGDEVLVVFRAASAYISPNWYPSKHAFHRQVPTWNYQAVHVRGRIHIRDDDSFVRSVVARLTRINELRAGQERPWRMTDSAPEFIDRMIAAVVGIEIRITEMVGKWKLSQNKEARDRLSAAEALRARGEAEASAAMLASLDPPA